MEQGNFIQTVLVTWPRWPPHPYMLRTLKTFYSGTKRLMTLKVGMSHQVLQKYQVCSNDDPELTLTYFTARSNLVPYAFVWEKGKTMEFFRNYYSLWFETSNRWPKWQEVSVDIKTLSPGGCMPPVPGLYTCIKSWKTLYKIRLQRDFLKLASNDQSDKMFLLTSKFRPQGVFSPCPGAIYMYMYKILPQGYIHVLKIKWQSFNYFNVIVIYW